MSEKQTEGQAAKLPKKSYQRPKLNNYGNISQITLATASGMDNDMAAGMDNMS